MDKHQLAELVKEMRQAQRQYFRLRMAKDLDIAKGLEKKVDTAIKGILSETQEQFKLN